MSPVAGPVETAIREILSSSTTGPLVEAILRLAAELDRRPGSTRLIDPADARTVDTTGARTG